MRGRILAATSIRLKIAFGAIGIVVAAPLWALSARSGNTLVSTFPTTSSVLSVAFPVILTSLSVFTAVVILVHQLIFNRYPVSSFRRTISHDVQGTYILLSVVALFAFVLWFFGVESAMASFVLAYLMLWSFADVVIFLLLYRSFDIQSQIRKLSTDMTHEIENQGTSAMSISIMMNDVQGHFRDAIEKREAPFAQSIIHLFSEVFHAYLLRRDGLQLDSDEGARVRLQKLDKDLLGMLFSRYRDVAAHETNRAIKVAMARCTNSILTDLIKCEKHGLFHDFMEELGSLFIYCAVHTVEDVPGDILGTLSKSYNFAVQREQRYPAIESEIERTIVRLVVSTEILVESNAFLRQRALMDLVELLNVKLNSSPTEEYRKASNDYLKTLGFVLSQTADNTNEIVWALLLRHGEKVTDKKDGAIFQIHANDIYQLTTSALHDQRQEAVIQASYHLRSLLKHSPNDDCTRLVEEKRLDLALSTLEVFPDLAFLFLPNYHQAISRALSETRDIADITDKLKTIFDKLARVDKSLVLYSFLEELNRILTLCEQQHKQPQEHLFDVYKDLLMDTLLYRSYENFKMVLYKFQEVIEDLDKNVKLSRGSIDYLLDLFEQVTKYLPMEADETVGRMYLGFLTKLHDKLPSINKSKDHKSRIVEIVFNIGVDAIETAATNMLRVCSNSLGWYAKAILDSGDTETFKVAISSADHLYRLSCEMNLGTETKVFIGTLFIIIGAYLQAKQQQSLEHFVAGIINRLPQNSVLRTSKRLREYSHKYWDGVFKADSRASINKFMSQLSLDK